MKKITWLTANKECMKSIEYHELIFNFVLTSLWSIKFNYFYDSIMHESIDENLLHVFSPARIGSTIHSSSSNQHSRSYWLYFVQRLLARFGSTIHTPFQRESSSSILHSRCLNRHAERITRSFTLMMWR